MLQNAGNNNDYGNANILRDTIHQVVGLQLNSIIAPRKAEKYNLPQNTLTHLQTKQVGLFIHENKL